jgi:hypothetical protein
VVYNIFLSLLLRELECCAFDIYVFYLNTPLLGILWCWRAIFLSNLPRACELVSVNLSSFCTHSFAVARK